MFLLILGILLWVLAHLFKRLAPRKRLMMEPQARSMVAGLVLVGLVLMVIGYRMADVIPVYAPLPGMGHANNTLMLISVYLFGVSGARSVLIDKIRHPMLTGVILWSVGHLLVNGDLASILLFGSMGIWAVAEMVVINRAGPWKRPAKGSTGGDIKNLIGTAAVYGLAAWIHSLLGYNVFAGNY